MGKNNENPDLVCEKGISYILSWVRNSYHTKAVTWGQYVATLSVTASFIIYYPNSWFHRPSILFWIFWGTHVTCTYITRLPQPIEIYPITRDKAFTFSRPASKYQKKLYFVSKHACIIAYEVRISCKGQLNFALHVFVTSKSSFMYFKTPSLIVYLLTSVLCTSQHQCHWLSQCLCKHLTIWRMTQNLVKTIIGNVASSYQVNLAIGIPNITENYINSQVFTCQHWVSAMLI